MCIHSCCCWKELKSACLATAMLTLVTSAGQIFVATAGFTGAMADVAGSPTGKSNLFTAMPDVQLKLYVVLAALDVFVVIFSIMLMVGLEKGGKCRAVPWLVLIPPYIMFESAINLYYLIQEFGHDTNNPISTDAINGGVLGYSITPLVYWVVKDAFVVVGFLCVASYYCNMSGHGTTNRKQQQIPAIQTQDKPATLPSNTCYTNACYNGPLPPPQISRVDIHDTRAYCDRPAVPPPRIYDEYGRQAIAPCRQPQYQARPQPPRQYNYTNY